MKVYEIKKFKAEFRDTKSIETGCTIYEDTDPESIEKFATIEEAYKELKKKEYKPTCDRYSNYYLVTEFVIECYEVDENGDFISGSNFDSVYNFKFDSENDDIIVELDKRFK